MNISPTEAEESLQAIQVMVRKTQKIISDSGAYNFLIVWGVIWLIGFLGNHFTDVRTASYIWGALNILGGVGSALLGIKISRRVRNPSGLATAKRIGWFWLLIFLYCFTLILVASPVDGKQLAVIIIIFVMIGWVAMSLLLSVVSVWWGLGITALGLIGYFFLPGVFFLMMAVLGGGGMIALGLYIRSRW